MGAIPVVLLVERITMIGSIASRGQAIPLIGLRPHPIPPVLGAASSAREEKGL
jgi:hypothetical protein